VNPEGNLRFRPLVSFGPQENTTGAAYSKERFALFFGRLRGDRERHLLDALPSD
jgi:hypothetical protein